MDSKMAQKANEMKKLGHFEVFTTIADHAIVTNPKMTKKVNGPFWGLCHVYCLCHSLFGPFRDQHSTVLKVRERLTRSSL